MCASCGKGEDCWCPGWDGCKYGEHDSCCKPNECGDNEKCGFSFEPNSCAKGTCIDGCCEGELNDCESDVLTWQPRVRGEPGCCINDTCREEGLCRQNSVNCLCTGCVRRLSVVSTYGEGAFIFTFLTGQPFDSEHTYLRKDGLIAPW